MAYVGEVLDQCGTMNLDFSKVTIVAVSGDGPNFCGHVLLHVDSRGGYYFHVAAVRGQPRYMDDTGYRRYLKQTRKRELKRIYLDVPNPDGLQARLEELMAAQWTWGVLPHNCVGFVEDLLEAGGVDWSSYTNCPTVATEDSIGVQVRRFISGLESAIYSAYGVPQ